ncbi:MAG: hypothetical protein Q7T55_00060 [Solirubrobacteraceae bacterium]|nr:hypothetical protein [Solirubrobacteraceae bacterium]
MVTSRPLGGPRSRTSRLLALSIALTASLLATLASSSAHAATTGPYKPKWVQYSDLKNHVVYRPTTLPAGQKLPVLVWGESGCIANGLIMQGFLGEIASHGVIVIANGGALQLGITNAAMGEASIDWAKKQNALAGGEYDGKLLADRIIVSGHSCGGLEAYQIAAKRPEIAGTAIMNSGQLDVNQAQLDQQKAPVLYVLGGEGDVAYSNGLRDYDKLPASLPTFLASDNNGHFGTYYGNAGGTYAKVLKDWILYRATGNAAAASTFTNLASPIWSSFKIVKKRNL